MSQRRKRKRKSVRIQKARKKRKKAVSRSFLDLVECVKAISTESDDYVKKIEELLENTAMKGPDGEILNKLLNHCENFANGVDGYNIHGDVQRFLFQEFIKQIEYKCKVFAVLCSNAGSKLLCPISKQLIKNGVVLKASNITYDRENLVKFLKMPRMRGEDIRCPASNVVVSTAPIRERDLGKLIRVNREVNKQVKKYTQSISNESDEIMELLEGLQRIEPGTTPQLLGCAKSMMEALMENELKVKLRIHVDLYHKLIVHGQEEEEEGGEESEEGEEGGKKLKLKLDGPRWAAAKLLYNICKSLGKRDRALEFIDQYLLKRVQDNLQRKDEVMYWKLSLFDEMGKPDVVKKPLATFLINSELKKSKEKARKFLMRYMHLYMGQNLENYLIQEKVAENGAFLQIKIMKEYRKVGDLENCEKFFFKACKSEPGDIMRQIEYLDFFSNQLSKPRNEVIEKYLFFAKLNKHSEGYFLSQAYEIDRENTTVVKAYLQFLMKHKRLAEYSRVSKPFPQGCEVMLEEVTRLRDDNEALKKSVAELTRASQEISRELARIKTECVETRTVKVNIAKCERVGYHRKYFELNGMRWFCVLRRDNYNRQQQQQQQQEDGAVKYSVYLGSTRNCVALCSIQVPIVKEDRKKVKSMSCEFRNFSNDTIWGFGRLYDKETLQKVATLGQGGKKYLIVRVSISHAQEVSRFQPHSTSRPSGGEGNVDGDEDGGGCILM